MVKNPPAMRETPVWFLGQEEPLEKVGYPLQYSLASLVAQVVKNPPAMQETPVRFLGWEDPVEKGMATTPEFLPGEFHGQRSLAGYSPWGHKELDMTERLSLHFAINYLMTLFPNLKYHLKKK